MESTDPSEIDRSLLERRISGTLDAARRHSRKTVAEIVQLLSPLQPRSAGGTARRQTWHEWLANPGMVSAVTLLAAGKLGGLAWARVLEEEAEAAYQAPARRGELVGQDQRMARVEEDVSAVREDVARLEGELATLRGSMAEEFANLTQAIQRLHNEAPLGQRARAAEKRLRESRRGDRNTG